MIGYVDGHEYRRSALGCREPNRERIAIRQKTASLPRYRRVNSARKKRLEAVIPTQSFCDDPPTLRSAPTVNAQIPIGF
jgi:hypothetical protein